MGVLEEDADAVLVEALGAGLGLGDGLLGVGTADDGVGACMGAGLAGDAALAVGGTDCDRRRDPEDGGIWGVELCDGSSEGVWGDEDRGSWETEPPKRARRFKRI